MKVLFNNTDIIYTENTFSGVYGLYCQTTKKWYVGQSKDVLRRIQEYLKMKVSEQKLIYRALKKYGIANFICYKLEECSLENLSQREVYWGEKLNSMAPNGYNLSLGLQGNKIILDSTREKMRLASLGHKHNVGRKHSEETKAKMSDSAKKNITEEVLAQRSKRMIGNTFWKANIGKKYSEERKEKIRQKAFGRKISEETKKKMSVTRNVNKIIKWLEHEAPWFVPQELKEIK